MIDTDTIRKIVIKGLKDHLGIEVVRSNQTGEPPAYPYLSYTITTPQHENGGTWGEYEDGKERKPFTQTWSITVQSDNATEAMKLTSKAHEWLDHTGTTYLNDNDVTVQSVGSIGNRDNMITIEYEYRCGFDVVFWALSEIDSTKEEAGYIESIEFNNTQVVRDPTPEELADKLQTRLTGR